MSCKKLIPVIYLKDKKAYSDEGLSTLIGDGNAVSVANTFSENGADEIIIFDLSYDDASHDDAISIIRVITKSIDTPVLVGGNVKRVEDVKKYLYAGAKAAILDDRKESNMVILKEVADRFGKEKIGVSVSEFDTDIANMISDNGLSFIFVDFSSKISTNIDKFAGILAIITTDSSENIENILENNNVYGVSGKAVSMTDFDFMKVKHELKCNGINTNTFESSIPFSDFKLNNDGLIPVIVQDYKTDEVLMLAYMNEEAYDTTITTGRMTYFSRSRQQLWIKGETSGHYQYVRSIEIDCDNDTLLAKVKQIGAACHTGNRSCFYRNLISTEYAETNPLKIFNKVMDIIEDRKLHPKEGSYTNYLFDKGIDKILKKCGEEATEIIIAAKNPDSEEIKYEISDFLYHVMVLMVLKDVTWDDIVKELANR